MTYVSIFVRVLHSVNHGTRLPTEDSKVRALLFFLLVSENTYLNHGLRVDVHLTH